MESKQIRLVESPFWLKVGPCPPKCDKKDLIYVVGSTFDGVIRVEEKDDFSRIKVLLNMMKPLQCGIFVSWISFKYEALPNFCFGCGRVGHGVKECEDTPLKNRMKEEDEMPYSVALRVESTIIGNESFKFELLSKKLMKQYNYTGNAASIDSAEEEITTTDEGHTKGETGEIMESNINLVSKDYGQVSRDAASRAYPINIREINKGDNLERLSSLGDPMNLWNNFPSTRLDKLG